VNGPEELAIIELQGDLEVEGCEGLTNKFMGDIHFTQDVIIYILKQIIAF
jgi:hypothetical protein